MKNKANDLNVEGIFEMIMADRKLSKQDFAAYIGYNASKMSQKFGTTWDMHWRVFIKLLPDLVRLRIIDPNLLITSDKNDQGESPKIDGKHLKTQGNHKENEGHNSDIMLSLPRISYILQ